MIALDFPAAWRFLLFEAPELPALSRCGTAPVSATVRAVVSQPATDGGVAARKGFGYGGFDAHGHARECCGHNCLLTFIPAILLLLVSPYKDSDSIRFHAWQSVLLNITAFLTEIAFGIVAFLFIFTNMATLIFVLRMLWVLWLVIWLGCVLRALNGKRFKIPLLGNIAEKLSMK